MDLERRINAFVKLGEILGKVGNNEQYFYGNKILDHLVKRLKEIIIDHHHSNPWFDEFHIRYALKAVAEMLEEDRLRQWVARYRLDGKSRIRRVAVIMAGNIPAVGFHDFICVLISGFRILVRNSSEDNKLIPWMADFLVAIEPGFKSMIEFTNEPLRDFDAVIATGSNNSGRYFDYYFGKYPHIIRRNMNSVAVLHGAETETELKSVADDILLYYGRGCRNVSLVFVPHKYDFSQMLAAFGKYAHFANHYKFFNNYEYNKAVMLVNKVPHFDTGFLLLTENPSFNSPLAVVHYQFYDQLSELERYITSNMYQIQCVASDLNLAIPHVKLGDTQKPSLEDYPDRLDTMEFLENLKNF